MSRVLYNCSIRPIVYLLRPPTLSPNPLVTLTCVMSSRFFSVVEVGERG